jgi:hypothetical protein
MALLVGRAALAQGPTAIQIVQRAIDNAGGDAKLDAVKTAEFISELITATNDTLSISVKKKGNNRCYISVLSFAFENTTTVYNNGHAVLIKNDTATTITDTAKLEQLALQCYPSIDYGYKKLGYKLTRVEDIKEGNFDCYGVIAESPLGSRTINYYDKKTGDCIMIVYASGGRTVFMNHIPYHGLNYTRDILLSDAEGHISRSLLRDISVDENPDDNWFALPAAGPHHPPELFKTGHFRYINGGDSLVRITRDAHKQVEGAKEYLIEWFTPGDYLLSRLKDASAPVTTDNIEFIKTRITLWSGNRYYCQYLTSGDVVGTAAFEKVD